MINVPATIALLITSMIIPAITSLLTKSTASVGIKQFITALLAAIAGLLITATELDGVKVLTKTSVMLALSALILSQATYWGFYKPHEANSKILPTVGLG